MTLTAPIALVRSRRRSKEARMSYVVAVLVVLFLALVTWASVTGRMRMRSCCSADPAKDLRMRAAFEHDDAISERRRLRTMDERRARPGL